LRVGNDDVVEDDEKNIVEMEGASRP